MHRSAVFLEDRNRFPEVPQAKLQSPLQNLPPSQLLRPSKPGRPQLLPRRVKGYPTENTAAFAGKNRFSFAKTHVKWPHGKDVLGALARTTIVRVIKWGLSIRTFFHPETSFNRSYHRARSTY